MTKSQTLRLVAASTTAMMFLSSAVVGAAAADPAPPATGLTGEGAISASQTTGNSSTTDLGAGLKLKYTTDTWIHDAAISADYGKQAGVTSKNRLFGSYQIGRKLNKHVYVFGRVSDERDRFSGFKNRLFVGGGLGAEILSGPQMFWAVEAAPGYRIDKLNAGLTKKSFAAHGGSKFGYKFNDSVAFQNDTDINYAKVSTQLINVASITAKLSSKLAARVSYEYRHETKPAFGLKADDTATRISLVYGL